MHPDGDREPLVVGVPGDREVDLKRLEAAVSPAEVEPFTGVRRHPALVKGYIGPPPLGEKSTTGSVTCSTPGSSPAPPGSRAPTSRGGMKSSILGSGEARQAPGLGAGAGRATDGGRGAAMDRRLLSQHRLPAHQERDLECEGRAPDVTDEMQRILCDEGIEVVTSAETLRVHGRSGEDVGIVVRTASGERNIAGSDILVASGRTPNTAGIGLAEAGVELDARGYIRVNGRLETSAPEVWAIGECAGSPQFTHVSHDDFRIIRDNLAGGQRSTRGRLVPYCMFTDPPLARVGLSETEAQRQGVATRVAKLPTSAVLRAKRPGRRKAS